MHEHLVRSIRRTEHLLHDAVCQDWKCICHRERHCEPRRCYELRRIPKRDVGVGIASAPNSSTDKIGKKQGFRSSHLPITCLHGLCCPTTSHGSSTLTDLAHRPSLTVSPQGQDRIIRILCTRGETVDVDTDVSMTSHIYSHLLLVILSVLSFLNPSLLPGIPVPFLKFILAM